jgi:hypothetical protein
VHRCLQVYTQQLPEGASQPDLVRMAALADGFELRSASAACAAELAQLPAARLEWPTVLWSFRQPDGMADLDSSRLLQRQARERVQQLLGDLELTVQQQEKRQQLGQLPHAALKVLLEEWETRVAAESTAVAAVALWVAAQEAAGGAVTLEERQELADCIRMVQLPPLYLATVVPGMAWLQGVVTMQDALMLAAARGVPQLDRDTLHIENFVPFKEREPQWQTWLDTSPRCSSACGSVSTTVQVPAAELADGRGGEWCSHRVCFGGYELGLRLVADEGGRVAVLAVLGAVGMAPEPGGGGSEAAHVAAWVDVTFTFPVAEGELDGWNGSDVWKHGSDRTYFAWPVGMPTAGWAPERLAPFLHEGKLSIQLTVTRVLPAR